MVSAGELIRADDKFKNNMRSSKRKRLKANGWRLTSAEEFPGLTKGELTIVEMKLALADAVKAHRQKSHLSEIRKQKKEVTSLRTPQPNL